MDYDSLSKEYRGHQISRVEKVRSKIAERVAVSSPGRVLPEDTELAIGTGRHIPMAVMFLDICSFSQRDADTLAEQDLLLRLLNLFFTEMIRIAEDYGGTIEKNTGDGLMVYFEDGGGEPVTGGCKRAVACALTMLDTNQVLLNPIVTASGIPPIQFRVGIDYGWVTVAQLGAARRFGSMVAVGTTANVAAKMLSVAHPGDVIIGEKAVVQLPAEWQRLFCRVHTSNSGWRYRGTNEPYPFYRYDGRWKRV